MIPYVVVLRWWFSKYGLCTSVRVASVTQDFVRNVMWLDSTPGTLGVGPSILHFNKPFKWFDVTVQEPPYLGGSWPYPPSKKY